MPAAYTEEEIEEKFNTVIDAMCEGLSLRKSLTKAGLKSATTFFKWLEDDKRLEHYARASEVRADVLLEEALNVARTPKKGKERTIGITAKGVVDFVKEGDMLGARKLHVETLLKYIANIAPRKYGPKPQEVLNKNYNVDANNLTPETVKAINEALENKY